MSSERFLAEDPQGIWWTSIHPLVRDTGEDMVSDAALSGHADMLVALNQRVFEPVTSAPGIDGVAPREALKRINEER